MDGKYDGPYESYFKNGKLKSRGTYMKNGRDGFFEYFNDDGSVSKETGNYKNGKKIN